MSTSRLEERSVSSSADLSAAIAAAVAAQGFADCAATVIGSGPMGRHYVDALRTLGVRRIRVCSRSAEQLAAFHGIEGMTTVSGGIERLACHAQPEELAIVATPIAVLVPAAERLAQLGFRRLLIEKPASLWSEEIRRLATALEAKGIEGVCAYNRVAYPSFHEAAACAARDGSITSCAYTFTEMIKPHWPTKFPAEELARWGIANSLHVMSLAHGLIGWPASFEGHRTGSIAWHPTGAVFVGSGLSERGIPFAYHADWGSTGRWSVEIHTPVASYRLCPLEQVFRRTSATGEWTELPVTTFAPQEKPGFVEQVAAMLSPQIRALVPVMSLAVTAALTRYGEAIFGYEPIRRR